MRIKDMFCHKQRKTTNKINVEYLIKCKAAYLFILELNKIFIEDLLCAVTALGIQNPCEQDE